VVEPQGTVSDPLQPANFTTSANDPLAHPQFDQVMLVPASGSGAEDGLAGTVTSGRCRTKSGTWATSIAWPLGLTTVIFGMPRSVHALLDVLAKTTAPANEEEALPTGVITIVAERAAGRHAATCAARTDLVASRGDAPPAVPRSDTHPTKAAMVRVVPRAAVRRPLTRASPHWVAVPDPDR
jgi:hypothetical protein